MERIILKSNDGYILTNGDTYGYIVYLGAGDKQENWREIPIEEYNTIIKAEEEKAINGILFE